VSAFRPFRDVRTRLLLIVIVALTLALGAASIGFNALLARTVSRDADAFLRQRAQTELAEIRVQDGRITTTGNADPLNTSRVWIFSGTRAVVRPRGVHPLTEGAAQSLANGPRRFLDVEHRDTRLYAVPILDGSRRRVGTLVTGISLDPYEHTRRDALAASLVLVVVLLVITGAAVWWLLRSALRPVSQMTEQAAAWSENDLDRRFDLGDPHDELTRLAATLDGLLDRLAASLRHERRFSAEMSHELRTPLAKLMAEAELTLRRERSAPEYRESLEIVLRNAQQIERIVETLVTAAQRESQPQGVSNAHEVAEAVVAAYADDAESLGVALELVGSPERVRLGVDRDLAERILHPVVENALRYGRSEVQVTVARDGSSVLFAVDDDGPGVGEDEREAIFEPAVRGHAGRTSNGAGAGLGLALARRLARSAAGDVEARAGAPGRFVVRLPAA
jgi:signal transduction histidine kinase